MSVNSKKTKLDADKVPVHVAMIMDGNGRWAKKRGLPRIAGHKTGMESVRAMVKACDEAGVGFLTLYAFSSENWCRPKKEVGFLMKLLEIYLRGEIKELDENNVRIQSIGRIKDLPEKARKELNAAKKRTKNNTGLTLTLALNYGGRREILDAAAAISKEAAKKGETPRFTEKSFSEHLYTKGVPDPDFVIRTSGEMRLSNFLLWQAAYAEIYITPVLWPDFRKPQLLEALKEFQNRERRFGDISAKAVS